MHCAVDQKKYKGTPLKTARDAYRQNLQHPRQQSSRVGHAPSSLTSSSEVTPDWLSTALKACFVWTGQCLAGGFNPLYPTGTVRQRHLYKPFLRIKPVVTFFFSREFSSMSTPKQGAPANHMKQLFTKPSLITILVINTTISTTKGIVLKFILFI